ncbi:hypothetical protein [Nannocystis pusilla]|uniref:hypothetical protein n=1 Tax=Nannocystis pusilla TaxID=889268 RepID=UPI003DA55F5E
MSERPAIHLLSRRQPLGILPTWRFWNDEERQRLVMPLLLAVTVPESLLAIILFMWLGVPWLVPLYALLSAQVFYGLVERRVRREVLRGGLRPAPSPESLRPHDWIWLASIGIASSVLLIWVAVAWAPVPALCGTLAMTAVLTGAGATSSRARLELQSAKAALPERAP